MERRDWCEAINDDAAADDGVGSASSHVRPSQTADRAVSLPPSHISPATRTRRWAGYFATGKGAEYCDKHACVSLRLSARISHERHVKKLYEYMISVAVAQFFSDDNAICTL